MAGDPAQTGPTAGTEGQRTHRRMRNNPERETRSGSLYSGQVAGVGSPGLVSNQHRSRLGTSKLSRRNHAILGTPFVLAVADLAPFRRLIVALLLEVVLGRCGEDKLLAAVNTD